MAADGDEAAEAQLQHFFAGRRPGWDIPPLHQGARVSHGMDVCRSIQRVSRSLRAVVVLQLLVRGVGSPTGVRRPDLRMLPQVSR